MDNKISPAAVAALKQLDAHLNPVWELGRNAVLAWTPVRTGLRMAVIPVRELLQLLAGQPDLLQGPRYLDEAKFVELCTASRLKPIDIITSLRVGPQEGYVPWQTVEGIIKRYSITETPHRAVMLFDIVGYSKLDPLHQIGQLNSLEYCINVAHRRLLGWGVKVDLARSTTGDGFYVWNRSVGLVAEVSLLILLLMVLAENELERAQERHGLVPQVRACFSVGRHYAYYQIEGLSPRGYDYIVGDVTITLARLIQKTEAGQLLIGDFERPRSEGGSDTIATPVFVAQADKYFRKLVGREFNGVPISDLGLSLTCGRDKMPEKLVIGDKHGMKHTAYNAVVRIYRGGRIPLMIGLTGDKPAGERTTTAQSIVAEIAAAAR
ncbi:MAG: hypothetical protein WCO00_04135 [Rhodospirillaceae bacterium]